MKAPQRHWTGTQCTFHWPLPPDNTSAMCPPQSEQKKKKKLLDSDTHSQGGQHISFDGNEQIAIRTCPNIFTKRQNYQKQKIIGIFHSKIKILLSFAQLHV